MNIERSPNPDTPNHNEQYLRVIRGSFPDFAIQTAVSLGEGHMNRTLLVNERYVFRFPKHEEAAHSTEKEVTVLRKVIPRVSLRVPNFEFVGKQTSGLPVVGYEIIPGELLTQDSFRALPDDIKGCVAGQVARFMDEIQSVPVDEMVAGGLLPKVSRINYEDDLRQLEVHRREFPPKIAGYVERRFREFMGNDDYYSNEPKLIHADLSFNHMVYNRETEKLEGVIDFGDAVVADPDFDYVYLLKDGGDGFTRTVMEARGEREIEEKMRKVGYFVTFSWVHLVFDGLDKGRGDWVMAGIEALRVEAESQ